MSKLTSGRCLPCQGRKKMAEIYRWKAGKGRRLFNARCPKCGNELSQTCVANLKNFHVMESEPRFVIRDWEDDGYDEGMVQGGDAYVDFMYGDSPDY